LTLPTYRLWYGIAPKLADGCSRGDVPATRGGRRPSKKTIAQIMKATGSINHAVDLSLSLSPISFYRDTGPYIAVTVACILQPMESRIENAWWKRVMW